MDDRPATGFGSRLRAAGWGPLLLLPGVFTAVGMLRSGAFFPDWTAIGALAVLTLLLLKSTVGGHPLRFASTPLALGAGALAAYCAWILLSSTWSDAPARALLEYQRALSYLIALVLFGLLGRTLGSARVMLGGLAFGCAVICVLGLAVWLCPDQVSWGHGYLRGRMNWPTSYWNNTGLIGALCVVFATALTCDVRAPRAARVLAAGAVPIGASVVFYTVSRGAAVAGLVGLLVLLVLGRSRGMLTGLSAALAGGGAAVVVAAGVTGLDASSVSAAALAEGHGAARSLGLIVAGTLGLRALGVTADARLSTVVLPRPPRQLRLALPVIAAGAATLVFVAVGGPHLVSRGVNQFVSSAPLPVTANVGSRFGNVSANGRIDHWRAAIVGGFDPHPLRGSGAGTFPLLWAKERRTDFTVIDAHSTYIEVLGELGLVGLVLLLLALGTMLGALVLRALREGVAWAGLAAAATAWAVHTGVDWIWENPACTLWVFAAGGLALGAQRGDEETAASRLSRLPRHGVGIAMGLGCLGLATVPVQILRSQERLGDAITAFRSGDCRATVRSALASNDALGVRPEPFELLGYCDVRAGRPELALGATAAAVRRDPGNWEFRYVDAVVRAAVGRDPRPATRMAIHLNPLSPTARAAERWFVDGRRRDWRRRGLAAPTLVPGP